MNRYLTEVCWFGVGFFLSPAAESIVRGQVSVVSLMALATALAVWYFMTPPADNRSFWSRAETYWFLIGLMTFGFIANLISGSYIWAAFQAFFIWINWNAWRTN